MRDLKHVRGGRTAEAVAKHKSRIFSTMMVSGVG
jgi:hypothetical protein